MAQLTYTSIDDNDIRSVTAPNTYWSSVTTQSTNISASNWRDEGLDERTLAAGCAYTGPMTVEYTGGGAVVNTGGAWQTLLLGATLFTIAGAWTQGQNVGVIRLRFATEFQFTFPAAPYGDSPTISFRLVYREDGGGTTVIPLSARTFYTNDSAWPVPATAPYLPNYNDNFKYCFLVPYTADGNQHTLTSVSVQVKTNANYTVNRTTLIASKFVKAVT